MHSSEWLGRVLAGKFRIERVVGEGGMGVVFEVMHTDLEERFAVKVLHGASENPELVRRFLREGKASAKIRSDHIARVHDVGRLDDGTPYLVMELLVGFDLESLLEREGPVSVQVAVDYIMQACDALGEAHHVGIVHRDVKPSNLFLTRRRSGAPCIKVLDFGISKLMSESEDARKTGAQDVFGSPLYMSPEALLSTRDVDARADIWALGIVLYELLTGDLPFTGETPAAIHLAIVNQPLPDIRRRRPDVPVALMDVLSRALAKDREARLPSAAAFAEMLAPFATPVGLEALKALRATAPPRRNEYAATLPASGGAGSSGPFVQNRLTSLPTVAAFETTALGVARRWWLPALLGGAVVIAGGAAVLTFVRRSERSQPPPTEVAATPVPVPALSFVATGSVTTTAVTTEAIDRVEDASPPRPHKRPRMRRDAGVVAAPAVTSAPASTASEDRSRLPDDRR